MSNENKKMKRNMPIILHNFSDMDRNDEEPFNIYEYDVSITHVDDLKRELVNKNHELSEKTKNLREKKKECDELNRIINKLFILKELLLLVLMKFLKIWNLR